MSCRTLFTRNSSFAARTRLSAIFAATALFLATLLCLSLPAQAMASQDQPLTASASAELSTQAVTTAPSVGKAKIIKAKAGAEKITVTFKRGANGTKSQVAYKKAGAKKWTIVNAGAKTKVVLKKLTGTKKYSVKVRSFTKANGKTYYGKWSAVKTAKPTIKSKLVGNWILQSGTSGDESITATQTALLKGMGTTFDLKIKGNGKATFSVSGADKLPVTGLDELNLTMTWKKKTVKAGLFSVKGYDETVTGKISDGKLVFADDEAELVFVKA